MSAVVSTEMIDGHKIEFHVDADGQFSAYVEMLSESRTGKTLTECRQKIKTAIRRANVELDIQAHLIEMDDPEWINKPYWQRKDSEKPPNNREMPITIRGFDDRTRNILISDIDGKPGKKDRHSWHDNGNSKITRRLKADEIKTYKRLRAEKDAAIKAFDDWVESVEIRNVDEYVRGIVEQRITAVQETAGELENIANDPRLKPSPKKKARR